MFIVIYKEVYTKALLIFHLYLSLVPGLFIVTRTVDLLAPPLIIYGFFNKKDSLSKALVTDTDKAIFWIYK
jgi:hypothetical protein